MLVVSHDRYFLDKVTNRTLELFRGTVDSYRGQLLGLLAAEGRAAAGRAADLREAAGGDRQDRGFHPPQRLRPETRPGRGPPQEARADRAGRRRPARSPRRRWAFRQADAERRHRAPRRAAGQGLRPAAVRGSRPRRAPRPALGHARPQRLGQDHAAAVPARARSSRTRAK